MQQMCLTADQTIEEMISNLEERLLENIQTEVQREKNVSNIENKSKT